MSTTNTTMVDVSRVVLPIAERILQENQNLGAIALANRSNVKEKLVTTKLEWKEMNQGAVKSAVTTAVASGGFSTTVPSDLELASTENILVKDKITFQTASKASKGTLSLIVTEVTNSTTVKVLKIGGADITISVGDVAYIDTNAHPEGSVSLQRRSMSMPHDMFNYAQIVKAGHKITGTLAATRNWDFADIKKELREQAYTQFARDLSGIVSSGVRSKVTIAGEEVRIAGGLTYFARGIFNNDGALTGEYTSANAQIIKNLAGADLTKEDIDDAFQAVIEKGGTINAAYTSPEQARKISGLEADKINMIVSDRSNANVIGGAVQILKSPIKVGGNEITAIYVDTKMEKDKVIFFNQNAIALVPMETRESLETEKVATAIDDNHSLDVLGEWSFMYRNAYENSFFFDNCKIG